MGSVDPRSAVCVSVQLYLIGKPVWPGYYLPGKPVWLGSYLPRKPVWPGYNIIYLEKNGLVWLLFTWLASLA